jgi:DNA polymerase III epsilon subunit family exonuclease
MANSPFMEKLNKGLREEERIFKLKEAVQQKNNVIKIDLLVNAAKYDAFLNEELKNKVNNTVKDILPSCVRFKVNYIKTITENKYILRAVMDYIYTNAPTVYTSLQTATYEIEVKGELISINITLEKYLFNYVKESRLNEEIAEYIGTLFIEDGIVNVIEIPNLGGLEIDTIKQNHATSLRIVDIDILKSYSGTIAQNPRYIIDVFSSEQNKLTVCGVVSNVRARYIEKIDKTIYSFTLNDTTGTINAKYFAKVNKRFIWEDAIKDGETLVVSGEYKVDRFDNRLVLSVRSIAKCSISYGTINIKSDFYTVSDSYINVFPKPFSDAVQDDLFTSIKTNDNLKNKTYVVFDLETTGIDPNKDKIVEIGAVKLIDGKIKESFTCLVNPECPIPAGATQVNGITDAMVENELCFSDVVGDFYKFTQDAVLVAHNAPFDIGFITRQGIKEKYDFDNSYIDTLSMARQKLSFSKYSLEFLCKNLNIPLEGAHRALNDTVATAKLFIKMMNM